MEPLKGIENHWTWIVLLVGEKSIPFLQELFNNINVQVLHLKEVNPHPTN